MSGNNFSLIWMCGVLESVSFFHNVPPCSGSSVSPWYALTWLAQTGCSPPTPQTFSSADHFASLRPARHRCTTFRMLTCFPRRHVLHDVSCSSRLSLFLSLCFFFFFFFPWRQLAAFGKQERRWKRAIVGKCSFLSGMTQAAAVISTVIVGHHQRASITPARPWHRQQVPALPARLAPTWLWKPSDIQKGTDLHWMHHWINTADYQLTYTVLYRTE